MNTTIKAIALAAVIALVAVTLVSEDSSAVEFTAGGFEYESTGNSTTDVTVVGWEGDSSEITISDKVNYNNKQYTVVSISAEAFKDKTGVVSPKSEENNVRHIIENYFREQEKNGRPVESKAEGRIVVE